MYFKIHNQRELIKEAIKKAGSYRKLSKLINIPRSTLVNYVNLETIPEENLNKIMNFLKIRNFEVLISQKLNSNWKQVKGGRNSVSIKKKNGTFEKQLKEAQNKGAKKFKEWHKIMKKEKPEEYHLIQYKNFKKVAGYKYLTKKGEKVRNLLEKQTADKLFDMNINYEYEPLIEINRRYFFPDFLINKKIIIECTSWKGETKAYKLKEKIKYLEKKYKVYVLIPKSLYIYYKILDDYLIYSLDEMMSR